MCIRDRLNIFNHQTNVDVDNRFTVYGIRDLGTELSPCLLYTSSKYDMKPAWVEQVENLLVALEMYRIEEEKAINHLADILTCLLYTSRCV